MTFGITIEKLVLIAFIAVMLIGPTRLPEYAAALGRTVRRTREFVRGAADRVKDDLGPEVTDVDWRQLDPRRYDPRRIVKEALWDDVGTVAPAGPHVARGPAEPLAGLDKPSLEHELEPEPSPEPEPDPEREEYLPRRFVRETAPAGGTGAPPGDGAASRPSPREAVG
jgi:sec-independent protein translocase protein TatB